MAALECQQTCQVGATVTQAVAVQLVVGSTMHSEPPIICRPWRTYKMHTYQRIYIYWWLTTTHVCCSSVQANRVWHSNTAGTNTREERRHVIALPYTSNTHDMSVQHVRWSVAEQHTAGHRATQACYALLRVDQHSQIH